jgi:hypothetical protein
MRSRQVGAVLLSIWSGLNLLLALGVTAITVGGGRPPALALVLTDSEIARLDPKVLSVVSAQAALANPAIAGYCTLVLTLVWRPLRQNHQWAWLALACTAVPLQVFGFVSDGFLGHGAVVANVSSSVVLLAGLALSRVRGGARP